MNKTQAKTADMSAPKRKDGTAQQQIARLQQSACEEERRLQEKLCDEEFLERYVYNNAQITETIIRRYLLRLSKNSGVPTLTAAIGVSALSPVKKPKTLDEAKRLADVFIET